MALRCTVDPRGIQNNLHNIAIGRGGSPPQPHCLQKCPPPLRPPHSMCLTNYQPSNSRSPTLLPLHHYMARPSYWPPCSSIPSDPEVEFRFHPHLGPPPTTHRRLSLTLGAMVCPHLSDARPRWPPPPTQPTIAPNQGQLQPEPGLSCSPIGLRS